MDKKGGEMSIQAIIMIVLGLVVLVILIIVFRGQIGKGTLKYQNLSEEAFQEAKGKVCEGFLLGRECMPTSCSTGYRKALGKGWTDCNQGEVCCEC